MLFLLLCWPQHSLAQFDIPPKPEGTDQSLVYQEKDLDVLNEYQFEALEQKLIRYADSTSTQILIAIISSTNDDDITLVATQWGQEWGVGQAGEDNGIVILLAKDDREIDISTGYGIEYRLTDIEAERIINRVIVPQFKQGNFYDGLDQATDAIFIGLEGEFQASPTTSRSDEFPFIIIFIILFVIFIVFIIAISSNRRGRGGGGNKGGKHEARDIIEAIIFSNMGKGTYGKRSGGFGGWSGGSSSGSSGGFGGFGGGSFGGGGASGSW